MGKSISTGYGKNSPPGGHVLSDNECRVIKIVRLIVVNVFVIGVDNIPEIF